jgi:hypothetical protein
VVGPGTKSNNTHAANLTFTVTERRRDRKYNNIGLLRNTTVNINIPTESTMCR